MSARAKLQYLVQGLRPCPNCHQPWWTFDPPVLHPGSGRKPAKVVLFCECPIGEQGASVYREVSLNWLKGQRDADGRPTWPPTQPRPKREGMPMICPACHRAPLIRVAGQEEKVLHCGGTFAGAQCQAVFHKQDDGSILQVFPDF